MAAVGPAVFALLLWGSLLGLVLVFCYLLYAVARDAGRPG